MITAVTESPNATRHVVQVDAHTLHVDTAGTAPDPHDLFDASLATCTAITLILYARRREMKLDKVHVAVKRDDSRERQGVYGLDLDLSFEGDLSDDDLERLLHIAGRCPIHRLMTQAEIQVRHSLVDGSTDQAGA